MAKRSKLLYLLLAVSVYFGLYVRDIESGLDPSWFYGLNLAYNRSILWGSRFIFTYGPLGALLVPVRLGNIPVLSLIFWIVIASAAVSCYGYILFSERMKVFGARSTNIFVSMLMLYIGAFPLGFYPAEYILSFILMLLLSICYVNRSFILFVLASILSVLSVFFKFSLGPLCLMTMAVFTAIIFVRNREDAKKYIIVLLCIPAAIYLGFLIYNPSLTELYYYFKGAYEISSGYISAMSMDNFRNYAYLGKLYS